MKKNLLIVGGILNLVLTLFHIFLGYQISLIENIVPEYHELLVMLNIGGTLFILFFTIASLAYTNEMLSTGLGKLVTIFVILLYGSRAVEEIIVSSQFSLVIFIATVMIALNYVAVLLIPEKQ